MNAEKKIGLERTECNLKYLDTLTFFKDPFLKVEEAYFSPEGNVQINHQGVFKNRMDLKGGFIPARTYLLDAGVEEDLINAVFKPDGTLKDVEDDGVNVWNFISPYDAAEYIAQKMLPVDRLVQPSVDAGLPPFGFNRHQQDHEYDVFSESLWLLLHAQKYRKDINSQTYVNDAIAAIAHDDGILISRGDHSLNSVLLLRHFIPDIEKNPRFIQIALSIIAHDPPRLREYLKFKDAFNINGNLDIDKAVKIMQHNLPPEALAIIGADRNQYGRRRVPEGIKSVEATETDRNIFPQLAWESRAQIDTKKRAYIMNMYFNMRLEPTEVFEWAGRQSKHSEYNGRKRLHVPSHMHERLKAEDTPYSVTAEQDWLTLYKKDLEIQIAAIMALNPHLKTFQLAIHDPLMPDKINRGRGLEERLYTIRRGHINDDLDKYQKSLDILSKSTKKPNQ